MIYIHKWPFSAISASITEMYFIRLPGDPPSSPEPTCLAAIMGRRERWRAGDGKRKVSILAHNENLLSNK
jgi:hypothetical protein